MSFTGALYPPLVDRGGVRFGVEPFDVGYGAGFQVDADASMALECPIVEGAGSLEVLSPASADRPVALAFVDGSMRVEARLTRTTSDDGTTTGVAGCASAGAVVVPADGGPLHFAHVEVRRYAIFTGGHRIDLPAQPGGWRWEADSVAGDEIEQATIRLQRHMRDAEVTIAEKLWADGLLTVVDGPLSMVRSGRDTPIIGYVKSHHRRMLAAEECAKVPTIGVGQRTSVFQIRTDLYGSYLRVGDPGPWASQHLGADDEHIVDLGGKAGRGAGEDEDGDSQEVAGRQVVVGKVAGVAADLIDVGLQGQGGALELEDHDGATGQDHHVGPASAFERQLVLEHDGPAGCCGRLGGEACSECIGHDGYLVGPRL